MTVPRTRADLARTVLRDAVYGNGLTTDESARLIAEAQIPPDSILLLPGEVEKLREAITEFHDADEFARHSDPCQRCEALGLLAASEEKP